MATLENSISNVANEILRLVRIIALPLMTDPDVYILVSSCWSILISILHGQLPVSPERLADQTPAGATIDMVTR